MPCVHFLKRARIRIPPQKKPIAFDPVKAMADKQSVMPVHDDIADLKIVRLL